MDAERSHYQLPFALTGRNGKVIATYKGGSSYWECHSQIELAESRKDITQVRADALRCQLLSADKHYFGIAERHIPQIDTDDRVMDLTALALQKGIEKGIKSESLNNALRILNSQSTALDAARTDIEKYGREAA